MDSTCFQPHQFLGDARQYQQHAEKQQLEQQQREQEQHHHGVLQEGPASSSMGSVDPSTVNPDVYAAACLMGDKGLQLINIYKELEDCRLVKQAWQFGVCWDPRMGPADIAFKAGTLMCMHQHLLLYNRGLHLKQKYRELEDRRWVAGGMGVRVWGLCRFGAAAIAGRASSLPAW